MKKMSKKELLERLEEVIYFYSNENKGEGSKEEEKEIDLNIRASEIIASFYEDCKD